MRRLLAHVLLAIALALAAPGAYAHALIHVGEALAGLDRHDDAGGEHPEHYGCALDAAYAGADALGSDVPPPIRLSAGAAAPVFPLSDRVLPCEALERFASRGPPVSR
jgi:hypothetical protein